MPILMTDQDKNREQLVAENEHLRRQVGGLEAIDLQRRRTAAELGTAIKELESRVEERTSALTEATEELAIFRRFAEASGQGFSMAGLDHRLVYVNPALCRMLGDDTPQDRLGQHLSVCYPEEANRRGREEIEPALLRDGFWQGELPLLSRQGKEIPTWQNSFIIRDEGGNPVRLAVVITDITDRKAAEGALRRKHRTLKYLLQSSDRERQLIAYEIHDGLAQHLAAALMQFQAFDLLKDKNLEEAVKAHDAGMAVLRQALVETRRLIAGVRPPVLDELGIVEAIAHLVHEQGLDRGPKINYRTRVDFDRLVPALENAIFRICQEALTNARQHSKSKWVQIKLLQRKDRVRIVVRDWGLGYDPEAAPKNRYGMEGIRQRARLLGGRCSIRSKPGKGTRVCVEFPVVERDEGL